MTASYSEMLLILALDICLKATIVMLLASVLDRLVKHQSACIRHCLWTACFFSLVTIPVATVTLPTYRIHILPVGMISQIDKGLFESSFLSADSTELAAIESSHQFTNLDYIASRTHEESRRVERGFIDSVIQPTWAIALIKSLLLLWLAGWIITLLPWAVSIWRSHLQCRGNRVIHEPSLRSVAEELCNQMCLAQKVEIQEGADHQIPMTWGVRNPVIVLPLAIWKLWSSERLQIVLLHEFAHVQRKDVLWQSISRIVCSFYWFHPLVWYAHGRMRIERELACDECVLAFGVKPSDYAEQLLKMAQELRMKSPRAAVAMLQPSGLERRVRAILRRGVIWRQSSRLIASLSFSTAIALAVLLAIPKLSVGVVQSQDEKAIDANDSQQQITQTGGADIEQTRRGQSEVYRKRFTESLPGFADGKVDQTLLEKALELDPTNPMVDEQTAMLVRRYIKPSEKLATSLRNRIQSGTATKETHAALSDYFLYGNKRDKALSHLEQIYKVDPLATKYSSALAASYLELGRVDEAVQVARNTLEQLQKNNLQGAQHVEVILFTLGKAYQHQGRDTDAVSAHELAIRFNPKHRDSLKALVELYRKLGNEGAANAHEETIKNLEEIAMRRLVPWNIDSTKSWIRLTIPDQVDIWP